MKEFIKKLPTVSIIFLIFAIISFIWGADQFRVSKENSSISIVSVDENSDLTENEGKNVCTSGKPVVVSNPVDTLTGVSADGYVLVRTVEMYQYNIQNDTVYKMFLEYQNDNIEGKNGELYENPVFPDNIKNAVFFADAKLENTGIRISESYLDALYNKESMVSDAVSCEKLENITVQGYKDCGDGYFTKADSQNWQIGDIRITYKYIPADSIESITICGMMKNGSITPENAAVSCVCDSVKSAQDIQSLIKGDYDTAAKGLVFFGVVEVLIAVAAYFISASKQNKKEQ